MKNSLIDAIHLFICIYFATECFSYLFVIFKGFLIYFFQLNVLKSLKGYAWFVIVQASPFLMSELLEK